jgi:tetratricopeptide (TPR) repeat protein
MRPLSRFVSIISLGLFLYTAPAFALKKDLSPTQKARLQQAQFFYETGDASKASQAFHSLLKSDPSHQKIREWTAKSFAMAQDRQQSLQIIKEGRELGGGGNLIALGNLIATTFYREDTFKKYQTGKNLYKEEEFSRAKKVLEEALAAEPHHVKVLRLLGSVQRKLMMYKEAKKTLSKVHNLVPWDAESTYHLADMELKTGNPQAAKSYSDLLMESKSNDKKLRLLRSLALFQLSEQKEAIDLLEKNTEEYPEALPSFFYLGKFYYESETSYWLARKYLSLYLKKRQRLSKEQKQVLTQGISENFKREAEELLLKIDQSLEL